MGESANWQDGRVHVLTWLLGPHAKKETQMLRLSPFFVLLPLFGCGPIDEFPDAKSAYERVFAAPPPLGGPKGVLIGLASSALIVLLVSGWRDPEVARRQQPHHCRDRLSPGSGRDRHQSNG